VSSTEITSAAKLHAALTAPDAETRLGTLEAVVADPKTALTFGLHADRDLIDVLLDQARSTPLAAEWLTLVNALAVFSDPRVAAFFTGVLAEHVDPSVLFLASDYLATRRARIPRATLEQLLLQNDSPARARAAAPLMMGIGVRTPAERLRVALLCEGAGKAPPFANAADPYLAELRGPFLHDARAALIAQGDDAATALFTYWPALDDATREWLIEWSIATLPSSAIDSIVQRVVDSNDDRLLRAALLRVAERSDVSITRSAEVLAHWLRHRDPGIRRAAVLKCAPPFALGRLVEIIDTDVDASVRAAALWRLAIDFNARALPQLLNALGDEDWQVRAAAVEGLIDVGVDARSNVRALVHDARLPVRAAAVDVLLGLRDDAWLAEHLLGGVNVTR